MVPNRYYENIFNEKSNSIINVSTLLYKFGQTWDALTFEKNWNDL